MTKVLATLAFLLIAIEGEGQEANSESNTGWMQTPLSISTPSQAVLGADDSVRISFDDPGGRDPVLITNVGSVGDVEEAGNGRLRATYRLPQEHFPQVAIVAVLNAEGTLLDWAAFPLHGRARVDSKTEPGATVSIEIEDAEFGPVKANRYGETSIEVVVPPGIEEGITIATDKVGNTIRNPVELGTPPFNRILGVCPKKGSTLLVLAVNKHGQPMRKADISVESNVGELTEPAKIGRGVYSSRLEVTAELTEGDKIDYTASIGESSTSCEIAYAIPEVPEGSVGPGKPDKPDQPGEDLYPRPPLAFGLHLGYVTNFAKVSTPVFLMDAMISPPILDRNLSLGVVGGVYFDKIEQSSANMDGEMVSTTVWTVPILGRITYSIPIKEFAIYGGVGAGIFMFYKKTASDSAGTTEEMSTTPAMTFVLGADYVLGPGRAVFEASYLPIGFGAMNMDGDLGGMFLTLGYRFNLLYEE